MIVRCGHGDKGSQYLMVLAQGAAIWDGEVRNCQHPRRTDTYYHLLGVISTLLGICLGKDAVASPLFLVIEGAVASLSAIVNRGILPL
jgi:hypothetical protein